MADQPGSEALTAWVDTLRRLRSAAGSVTDPVQAVRELQGVQEDLVRGMFLPVDAMVQITDQLAEPLRQQAEAFERASVAFAEIAAAMRTQADLLASAGDVVRGPTDALKGAVGAKPKGR
ncbi:MAG TPA: hypothetical protein VGI54_06840 [Solirubrobacteraceae bacterium]|jgi:hypothetical protein